MTNSNKGCQWLSISERPGSLVLQRKKPYLVKQNKTKKDGTESTAQTPGVREVTEQTCLLQNGC